MQNKSKGKYTLDKSGKKKLSETDLGKWWSKRGIKFQRKFAFIGLLLIILGPQVYAFYESRTNSIIEDDLAFDIIFLSFMTVFILTTMFAVEPKFLKWFFGREVTRRAIIFIGLIIMFLIVFIDFNFFV